MFCPPSEEETQQNTKNNSSCASKVSQKNKRKRKKKSGRKNIQTGAGRMKKKQCKFAPTMSAWAESFTFAATWQLKHQLAYWKSRAKALEYENSVLHDLIRRKNYVGPSQESREYAGTQVEFEPEEEGQSEEEQDDEEEFVVSEEFIQFLQDNAKFKEEARLERERLREKNNEVTVIEEEKEPTEEMLKDMYGDKWQRITALEMVLQSNFIHESDQDKPTYWPNIPFNFNFG